jgi:hypothetical protein
LGLAASLVGTGVSSFIAARNVAHQETVNCQEQSAQKIAALDQRLEVAMDRIYRLERAQKHHHGKREPVGPPEPPPGLASRFWHGLKHLFGGTS